MFFSKGFATGECLVIGFLSAKAKLAVALEAPWAEAFLITPDAAAPYNRARKLAISSAATSSKLMFLEIKINLVFL